MPISHDTIRDLLMPGLREVVSEYAYPPSMWERLFEDVEARIESSFAFTRQALVDNLYNLPPMTLEQSEFAGAANNGEDDGIDFPHKWKGV